MQRARLQLRAVKSKFPASFSLSAARRTGGKGVIALSAAGQARVFLGLRVVSYYYLRNAVGVGLSGPLGYFVERGGGFVEFVRCCVL